MRIIGLAAPINQRKVFFLSFGGRRYDDSPKCIYEEMLTDERFADFKFVWGFVDNPGVLPGNPIIVKTDTPRYFWHVLSSRFWVTNASVERGLRFKRRGNVCINTWHGTPIKHIGHDTNSGNENAIPDERERFDMLCAQSKFDQAVFAGVYNVDSDMVPVVGLPRNDSLKTYTSERVLEIKKKLGLPEGKKILLYTPTYREYSLDENNIPTIAPPIDLAKWRNALGGEYILLVRAHYVMTKGLDLVDDGFAFDVSSYEPLNDLYAISDAMVSDYSSTLIDYAVLGRPMFCFAYDLGDYQKLRGLYEPIFSDLPCEIDRTEDELLGHIVNADYPSLSAATTRFSEKYVPLCGNASKAVLDEIVNRFIDG